MTLEFSGTILKKSSNNDFMKIRSVGACGRDGGRADRYENRIVAIHNFANAPIKPKVSCRRQT